MKTTKIFLMLILMTAFGTTEFFAQTTDGTLQTAKPKRTYTKKSSTAQVTTTASLPSVTATTGTKQKRTYAKRTTTSTTSPTATTTVNVPPVSASANTDLPKPKRTYTRRSGSATTTVSSPAAPLVNTPAPTTKTTAQRPTYRPSNPTVKQQYNPQNGGTYNGHQVLIGPKGGKYYINKNGNKTYIK